MTERRPTFFIPGVPKSGTSSLYYYLAQHPQIFMSPIKEPEFFAAEDLLRNARFREGQQRDRARLVAYLAGPQRPPGGKLFVTEWDEYVQLFRNARDEIAVGEASTGYFWLPSAAGAIHARVPDARLLFILRDPTERLFSWYVLSLREQPGVTFKAWFEHEETQTEWWSAVDAGRYATHLERFLRFFPRHQMRVYLHEDFRRDPQAVVRDALEFLGVDTGYPIDTTTRHNKTLVPRFRRVQQLKRRLFGDGSVVDWLPAGLQRRVRGLYMLERGAFTMSPQDRRMVIDHYRDEIRRTAALIDRDLSAWLR